MQIYQLAHQVHHTWWPWTQEAIYSGYLATVTKAVASVAQDSPTDGFVNFNLALKKKTNTPVISCSDSLISFHFDNVCWESRKWISACTARTRRRRVQKWLATTQCALSGGAAPPIPVRALTKLCISPTELPPPASWSKTFFTWPPTTPNAR